MQRKHHLRRSRRSAFEAHCAEFAVAPEPLRVYDMPFACAEAIVAPLARGIAQLTRATARALHRAYCVRRETREASLLGIPAPADLEAAWVPPRRTLQESLLIGSKLVDLAATHPDALKWSAPDAGGRRKIAGREGGLKRYLAESCPSVRYTTAMRYRRLAQRLRQFLDLPASIPLEWLLHNATPASLTEEPSLLAVLHAARRRLDELLAGIHTQRELARHLDRHLDSDRLSFAPRGKNAAQETERRDEILRRCEARLDEAVASGRELTRDEKKALKLLQKLRRLASQLAPPR